MFWNPADKSFLKSEADATTQSLVDHLHDIKKGMAKQFVGRTTANRLGALPAVVPKLYDDPTEEEVRKALTDRWIFRCQPPELQSDLEPECATPPPLCYIIPTLPLLPPLTLPFAPPLALPLAPLPTPPPHKSSAQPDAVCKLSPWEKVLSTIRLPKAAGH